MAIINVTTTVDENNGTGSISLREAVIEANGSAGDDTIVLQENQTYTLTRRGFGEDVSATGDLDILSGVGKLTILASTVSGSTGVATINGGGIDRVFDVKSGANLNLQNLTVKGGKPIDLSYSYKYFYTSTFVGFGGGITNAGTLNLSNVVITGNRASNGGAIFSSGTMNINSSSISSNSASLSTGGGIFNSYGTMNINNSTISSNSASSDGGGIFTYVGTTNISNSIINNNNSNNGNGGGIDNIAGTTNIADSTISSNSVGGIRGGGINSESGTMNITNSTISSNSASNGGGINNYNGSMNITNSTISSNSASNGGGIRNRGDNIGYNDGTGMNIININNGTMNIINSTISSNSASSDGGGIRNDGGGLINLKNTTITGNIGSGLSNRGNYPSLWDMSGNSATVLISNSIIAQNHQNQDIVTTLTPYSYITNQGYNLIGNATGVIGGETIFNQTSDKIGTETNPLDAKLRPLQDNGGETFTHALLEGSPAINTGNTDLTTDQRSYQRDTTPDIGAYEDSGTTPPPGETTGPDNLIGTAGPDTIDGLAGNDSISGIGGNDRLLGSDGDDSINGGAGDDTMIGGAGNDTYVLNSARDRVTEALNTGRDGIFSTVTYKLPANVENLTLQGTQAINGTGNGSPNQIVGNSATNKMKGGGGNDTLTGLGGSDSLTGDTGNDSLDGGGGNDTLLGNAGNDKMKGGAGADRFLYNTSKDFATSAIGIDTITDFTRSQSDKIVLDKTTFTRISSNAGNGFSVASEFASLTSNWDRSGADIVYDRDTGKLYYNQNGTVAGYGTGGHFITLTNKPALSASDFIIQA